MYSSILSKLNQIEAEMKKIGFWQDHPPAFECNNYLDAPSFELWLQCVFLLNARLAANSHSLPKDSRVGLMALRQYDYHSVIPKAHDLMRLLHEFDNLVLGNEGASQPDAAAKAAQGAP